MDEGRRWALETFGKYGPTIRTAIPAMVRAEHEASLDAQEASQHRSLSVYGEYWRGILERFEGLARYPGATLVRPKDAPYKIIVTNGVGLFPWRFAKTSDADFSATAFSISDARIAMTHLKVPAVQGMFDIELPDAGLTDDEEKLVEQMEATSKDPDISVARLIVVAIASSPRGLFSANWGAVSISAAGFPAWEGYREDLLAVRESASVAPISDSTFTDGEVPTKLPQQEDGDRSAEDGR